MLNNILNSNIHYYINLMRFYSSAMRRSSTRHLIWNVLQIQNMQQTFHAELRHAIGIMQLRKWTVISYYRYATYR